jgi:hypothetical protein
MLAQSSLAVGLKHSVKYKYVERLSLHPAAVTREVPALPVTIKSSAFNTYLTHCPYGRVEGDRTTPQAWEEFLAIHIGDGIVAFKSVFGTHLTATWHGNLEGDRHHIKERELFTLEVHGDKYAIKSYHGKYVCLERALPFGGFKVVANREAVGGWEQFFIDLA